ncbi:MAG: peptidylprolyl isomerase [Sinomicrobium sp.]|nr:peptidylprolyl isomerase [Sinomicrobium sp.]
MKRSIFIIGVLFMAILTGCREKYSSEWMGKQAPETFSARFETTKGDFTVRFQRNWSPLAVDRVYQLIKSDFYTDVAVFRVAPDYVAQFGISNDSLQNSYWSAHPFPDEPVKKQNTQRTVAFARGGPQSRNTQLFINLANNSPRLDTLNYMNVTGFPGLGEITEGWETVTQLYGGYGDEPSAKQDSISLLGNAFLMSRFPELDYIITATVIEE